MSESQEPTVEEILQSIKQVIARDNRSMAAEERQRREAAGVKEASENIDDSDVLDLAEGGQLIDAEDEGKPEADADSQLVTEQAQANMRESLAALTMLSEPGATPKIVRSGETSLEDLVRELLRPALSEWLDKNLPPLVEDMVATEIRRIVARKD